MSTRYQFINKETGEPVSLNSVDEAMCEYFGQEVKPDQYSFAYEIISLAGVLILKKEGGEEITEEIMTKWLNDPNHPERLEEEVMYRKFLLEDYTFRAWYEFNY